jgi:hypothetical protein
LASSLAALNRIRDFGHGIVRTAASGQWENTQGNDPPEGGGNLTGHRRKSDPMKELTYTTRGPALKKDSGMHR